MTKRLHTLAAILLAAALVWAPNALAFVNDCHNFALEAAEPYVKDGFEIRYDFWEGSHKAGERKAIRHQLFKGNEYWFWLASDSENVRVTVHAYDEEGKLVEAESWDRKQFAAVRVKPKKTGTYILVVEVKEAPTKGNVNWALIYGYR